VAAREIPDSEEFISGTFIHHFPMNTPKRSLWTQLTGLTAALVIGVSTAQAVENVDAWGKDLAVLRKELPARHKNLFFKTTREDFEAAVTALESELPKLSDTDALFRLSEIVAGMGDAHTLVLPHKKWEKDEILPLRVEWFADGLRVIRISGKAHDLLSKKIIAVNDVPIADVLARLEKLIPGANEPLLKNQIPSLFPLLPVWQYLHMTTPEGGLKLTCEKKDGSIVKGEIRMGFGYNATDSSPAKPCSTFLQSNKLFFAEPMDGGQTLYVQYNKCWGREQEAKYGRGPEAAKALPELKPFFDKIIEQLESGAYQTLIFDMRWNGGGDSPPGAAFIERLSKLETFNQKGRIFVLIGRKTFSSAMLNAIDFKVHTAAIFVGEPTGGTVSHYGQTEMFTLPHSKLKVQYSTKFFSRLGGAIEPLVPDIKAELTIKQYLDGIDPAIEAIRRYQAKAKAGGQ
jgi:hypothetical protein